MLLPLATLVLEDAVEFPRLRMDASEMAGELIALGDLNDEPGDASVRAVLGATRERPVGKAAGKLWNPGWAPARGREGTERELLLRRGRVAVRPDALLSGGAITWDMAAFRVAGAAELGEAGWALLSRSGRPVGFEPTRGTGVSDHLPVVGRIGIAG